LMFAMLLTTPAWAETSFATLKGIPAEAMTVHEKGSSSFLAVLHSPLTSQGHTKPSVWNFRYVDTPILFPAFVSFRRPLIMPS